MADYIELIDTQSDEIISLPLRKFIEQYNIQTSEDSYVENNSIDRVEVPLAAVTWRGEVGNLNDDLRSLLLGERYFYDISSILNAVFRGFKAQKVGISSNGSYVGTVNLIDGMYNGTRYYTANENTKLMKLISNLRSVLARAQCPQFERKWLNAAQVRLLTMHGYSEPFVYEMRDNCVIYDDNNNLMVGANDIVRYLSKVSIFDMMYSFITDGKKHTASFSPMFLRLSVFLTGECDVNNCNVSYDDGNVFFMPNKVGKLGHPYYEPMYQDDCFERRSYILCEIGQLCAPALIHDVQVDNKVDFLQVKSGSKLTRTMSRAQMKRYRGSLRRNSLSSDL